MSDSTISPAPPSAVKLTEAGQNYWSGWASSGHVSECRPGDAYVVTRAAWHGDAEHYHIIQTHSYSSLWVDSKYCVAAFYNPATGEWEEVQ